MKKPKILEDFSNFLLRKYQSKDTIKTYLAICRKFIFKTHPDTIEKLTEIYLTNYLSSIRKSHYSISTYNQYLAVLKLIYCELLGQNKLKCERSIKQFPRLKNLPSPKYVIEKINSIKNVKHKTILKTLLTTGIRMNELLNIKLCDIKRNSMQILITHAKGNRSEFVILTESLLIQIEKYYRVYKPKKYLFEGVTEKKYSASSVNKIVKKNIGNQYSAHWLRAIAITYLINQKEPLHRTKLFSRHKSDKSISWYYHYDKNTINEIRELMNELAA